MHHRLRLPAIALAAASLSACATSAPVGSAFTDLNLPVQITSAAGGSKTGTATCRSILGLVATGDCSFTAAKADGGITTVTHADWKANNLLGLIGTYTLTVTGD